MNMVAQDKLEKDRSHAKNNVEEYVYEMREKLYGSLEMYITEEVSNDQNIDIWMQWLSVKHKNSSKYYQ